MPPFQKQPLADVLQSRCSFKVFLWILRILQLFSWNASGGCICSLPVPLRIILWWLFLPFASTFRNSYLDNLSQVFLKISQYSQENICVGISFLIKMQAFRAPALLKWDSNTGVFCKHWEIFKNTYFEEHLQTAASDSFTWTFSYMNK